MVYVDDSKPTGLPYPREHSCHMMADSLEELHEFADRIALHRDWFQGDHYDLFGGKRALAVKNGAVEVSSRMLVMLRRKLRAEAGGVK